MKPMRKIQNVAIILLTISLSALWAHEGGFPSATLKKVFPDATGFTARKKTLTPEQVKRAEADSGSKVQRNDNPLSFYVALGKSSDASGALGTVLIVDARGPKGAIDLALGVRRDGTIARVVVSENHDDPALSSTAFLDQIQGKSLKSQLKAGQDIKFSGNVAAAQAMLNAIRRGLILLAAAQGN